MGLSTRDVDGAVYQGRCWGCLPGTLLGLSTRDADGAVYQGH